MNSTIFTFFAEAPLGAADIAPAIGGIGLLIIFGLLLLLLCFWIFFPVLVYRQLKGQQELLRQIGLVLERSETELRSNNSHLRRIAEAVNPTPPMVEAEAIEGEGRRKKPVLRITSVQS